MSQQSRIETVQSWLNVLVQPTPPLAITGKLDKPTAEAIKAFQTAAGIKPTGKLSSDTWKAFGQRIGSLVGVVDWVSTLGVNAVNLLFGRPITAMRYDRADFYAAYMKKFGGMDRSQISGLDTLLTFIERDSDVTDPRWVSYFLITAKVETANTYQPIREHHCDDVKGGSREYSKPHPCPAGIVGHKSKLKLTTALTCPAGRKQHCYFGRGYVQLTFAENYKRLGDDTGYGGESFLHYPEKVMDPTAAYKVMSYGIRNGRFTGKKIADYIHGTECDYLNARKVINGITDANRTHVEAMAKAMEGMEEILVHSLI